VTQIQSYREIELHIIRWAEDRKIIPNSTPQSQLLKAFEEMGELASGVAKKNREATIDAVGDTMVCLINMCALLDLDLVECMAHAYDQIKHRRGTLTPEGIFIKE
jgi:NTP pyrophosphatase (non-canonical NTP hydrolase)